VRNQLFFANEANADHVMYGIIEMFNEISKEKDS
jgi:hypothetical protein